MVHKKLIDFLLTFFTQFHCLFFSKIGINVLQQASVYWAANTFGTINLAIAVCGCCVFVDDKWTDGRSFINLLYDLKINIFGIVPSLLSTLKPNEIPKHVNHIISWGEQCSTDLREIWINDKYTFKFVDLLLSTEYWLSFKCENKDGVFTTVCDNIRYGLLNDDGEIIADNDSFITHEVQDESAEMLGELVLEKGYNYYKSGHIL